MNELPTLPWAEKIAYLAWKISQNGGMKADELEVRHIFKKGLYVREFNLPAHFIFIGRVHRKGHVVELLEGKANVITEQGTTTYSAGNSIRTPPGFQTVAYTLEPCLVRSVHENPAESRNVEELEDEFFEPIQPVLSQGQSIQERLI